MCLSQARYLSSINCQARLEDRLGKAVVGCETVETGGGQGEVGRQLGGWSDTV